MHYTLDLRWGMYGHRHNNTVIMCLLVCNNNYKEHSAWQSSTEKAHE